MAFQKVEAEKLASSVVRQIELMILRGILRPGERLPSERELADRMGVSRPSLRDAIGALQGRGLLDTRAGAGVYVAESLGTVFPNALTELFATHDEAVFDYISFRRDLEGMAAERAVMFGSDTDLQVVDTLFRKMEAAHQKRNPAQEAELDAEFHIAIIEASHNVVMLHMMRAMFQMLREGVFYNRQVMFRQRTTRDMLLEQHQMIHTAIMARDAVGARSAVEHHLSYVEASLLDQKRMDHNESVARLRLEHERSR